MVSTTSEIVMSAFGEKIGTNMDNRLGDPSYVLVPLNVDDPSRSAEVLHISKLDPANPLHQPSNTHQMDSPEAENLIREIAVRGVMSSWSHGSNRNVRSLALQEVAREEFGLPDALEWDTAPEASEQVDIELTYNREAFRDFLRTQYELTQEKLRERGISQLVGYRPMVWPDGGARPAWSDLEPGTDIEVPDRPLAVLVRGSPDGGRLGTQAPRLWHGAHRPSERRGHCFPPRHGHGLPRAEDLGRTRE